MGTHVGIIRHLFCSYRDCSLADMNESTIRDMPISLKQFLCANNQITFCGLRDPSKYPKACVNGEEFVTMISKKGYKKVSPALFNMAAVQKSGFDIICPMYDCPFELKDLTRKRANKSVRRSLKFLDSTLDEFAKYQPNARVLGILLGAQHEHERMISARQTDYRNVAGYLFDGLNIGECSDDREKWIKHSLSHVDSNKPRFWFGVNNFQDLVLAIESGIDVIDGSIPYILTEKGIALNSPNFEFVQSGMPMFVKLWDDKWVRTTDPILSPAECDCICCSELHSRAYIHHLLHTNEINGSVFLMHHNINQYIKLFEIIRLSIDNGRFEHLKQHLIGKKFQ